MPLGGKTFIEKNSKSELPNKVAEKIILDLLLRLLKRTSEGNLKLSNDEKGLLLAEVSFENMQGNLPIIKSNWINTGNTNNFLKQLNSISAKLWSIKYNKHEGIIFENLTNKISS